MRRVIFLIVLGVLILSHVTFPAHAQLDWPTVALLAIFVSVLFWPELKGILPTIKKVRIGNTEIETWESVRKLHQDVEKAEGLSIASTGAPVELRAAETAAPFERAQRILTLASKDKEMAILRISTEIEKELTALFQRAGVGQSPPHTIRGTVDILLSKGILPQELAAAIIEFRNVRNKVAHPIRGDSVDESVLTSTIDSGVRILQLLLQLKQP